MCLVLCGYDLKDIVCFDIVFGFFDCGYIVFFGEVVDWFVDSCFRVQIVVGLRYGVFQIVYGVYYVFSSLCIGGFSGYVFRDLSWRYYGDFVFDVVQNSYYRGVYYVGVG